MAEMTVADKVGQLFLVTFQGNDISDNSDIASLVRDYRVGGVVLLPANSNFRGIPVDVASPQSSGRPGAASVGGDPAVPVGLGDAVRGSEVIWHPSACSHSAA
jgi:hypothetical protein